MKKLTIIIPYYNRPYALNRLNEILVKLDSKKFNIIISELNTKSCLDFNTGKALNLGIEKSKTDWVLKNDVDCVPENGIKLYEEAFDFIQNANENEYKIFGAKYLDNNNIISKKLHCGNEFLIHKSNWEKLGRIPEWKGYMGEDYLFEYFLEKNLNSNFTIPFVKKHRDVSSFIRDNIVKIKNKENKEWFLHYWHQPVFSREFVQINLEKLYKSVMKDQGYING
jgi:hypothetical protein